MIQQENTGNLCRKMTETFLAELQISAILKKNKEMAKKENPIKMFANKIQTYVLILLTVL